MSEDKKPDVERVGGKSALDEALRPAVSSALAGLLDWVLDVKPINEAMKFLSPGARQMASLLPMGAGYAFAKLPMSLFPNPTVADFFEDVVVEMARHIDRKIKAAGSVDKVSPQEYADALHEGAKVALERKYAVDPMGFLHRGDCVKLQAFRRPQQQRTDRNGQPIPPPPSQLQEVTLQTALDQKLQGSPCCFHGIQADLKKAEAPKAEKKSRSPMEVIGGSGDPDLQAKFNAWYKGLSAAERTRVLGLLKHLDSIEEFKGLMALDPEIRDEMLTLLENTNTSFTVSRFLGLVAGTVKSGATNVAALARKAWEDYKKFDESLGPTVEKLKSDLKKPLRRRPWWHMFLPI